MKTFRIFLLFICITSCAPIYVNYDYEKATNFSQYKTYNFYDDMETGFTGLDEKRFLSALEAKLNTMGLLKSEAPDFLIDIQSSEFENNQNNTVGVGVGGGNRGIGGGVSIGIPLSNSNLYREIIIEFIDENKTGLFWQAKSESNFKTNATPEKREAKLEAVVEKILKGYPPEK